MGNCEKNDWAKTKQYRNLKRSMIQDLENAGLNREPYLDMVSQYMAFWVQLQMLNQDINERGICVEYQNGNNQMGVTDNKSVAAAVRVNARMESILASLGYKARALKSGASAASGEDDEL